MKTPTDPSLPSVVRRFIEDAGSTTQSFGLGRVVGQIYAYLYFSSEPHSLDDLQKALGISKGSASMGVRQLEQWGALRKVWVRGDRKGYYEASEWLGRILRNAVLATVGTKLAAYGSLLDEAETAFEDPEDGDGEAAFIKDRIQNLRDFQQKAQSLWNSPIVKLLLK